MNRTVILIAASLGLASSAIGALTEEQLSALKQNLANLDPAIRSKALEELLRKEGPKAAGNDVVPLLSSALADQDAKVRANAAAVLAAISLSTLPKFHPPNENITNLRSYGPLQAALVAAFNDPDEETRKNALCAYALTFDVPTGIQDQLASRFDSERPISPFRTAILYALTIDGTATPAAKTLLLRVANDKNEAVQLAQVLKDSKKPPIELLPPMFSQFTSTSDADKPRRQAFVAALGKFGAAAKPYLPALQQAADVESDGATKQNIMRAVAAIDAAK